MHSRPPSSLGGPPSYRPSSSHRSQRGPSTNSQRGAAAASGSRAARGGPPPAESSAQAIFYDDNPDNFLGIVARGKHPAIRPVLCHEPVTNEQLQQAIDHVAAASSPSYTGVRLFFFFDFDLTLSLADGLEVCVCASFPRSLI